MKKIFIPLLLIVFLSSCSVFQETTSYEEVDNPDDENSSEEVYVFDEVKEDEPKTSEIKDLNNEIDNTLNENKENSNYEGTVVETTITEPAVSTYEQPVNNVQFYVQLGAFSTLKRAETFSSKIDSEVPFGLSIIFDASKEYYIVRSSPYATRSEAENVRDELKHKNKFRDCFIVTE